MPLLRTPVSTQHTAVQGPVADGFRHVGGLDVIRLLQVSDRARHLDDPVVRACTEPQRFKRHAQQIAPFPVDACMMAKLIAVHAAVKRTGWPMVVSLQLDGSGRLHPFADRFG